MTAPGKERFHHLDGIRGIAALAVVIGHGEWANHIRPWAFQSMTLWVDFFFVLSGFVIAYNYQARLGSGFGVGNFMYRRMARLYPAHFVMLILLLGYELLKYATEGSAGIVADHAAFEKNTAPAFLASLALVQAMGLFDTFSWNAPAWSISTETWTYLLFGLVFVGLKRSRAWIVACTVALIAISYWVIVINPNREYMNVQVDYGFFRCLIGFGLGVLCYNAWLARNGREARGAMNAVQLSLMLGAFVAVAQPATPSPWTLGAPVLFGALVYLLAVYRNGWLERVLLIAPIQFLGTISYSLYISHAFTVRFATTGYRVIAPRIEGVIAPELAGDLFMLIYLALAVGFGWLVWRFVETPANTWLVARLGRRKSDPEKTGAANAAF